MLDFHAVASWVQIMNFAPIKSSKFTFLRPQKYIQAALVEVSCGSVARFVPESSVMYLDQLYLDSGFLLFNPGSPSVHSLLKLPTGVARLNLPLRSTGSRGGTPPTMAAAISLCRLIRIIPQRHHRVPRAQRMLSMPTRQGGSASEIRPERLTPGSWAYGSLSLIELVVSLPVGLGEELRP